MDVKRIKAGTKIKIIAPADSSFCQAGSVGFIITDSCFHQGGVVDNAGYYWADFGHPECPRICFGKPYDTSCFKVLKY